MLCLSRKTDYALIALGYLAERPEAIVSAREISKAYELPLPLLMNLLKRLQNQGVVRSVRGVNGGYKLGALQQLSLHELIRILEGKVEAGCDHEDAADGSPAVRSSAAHAPVQALHAKLMQFLHDVPVTDLVLPGRRIDVPSGALRRNRDRRQPMRDSAANGKEQDTAMMITLLAGGVA